MPADLGPADGQDSGDLADDELADHQHDLSSPGGPPVAEHRPALDSSTQDEERQAGCQSGIESEQGPTAASLFAGLEVVQ